MQELLLATLWWHCFGRSSGLLFPQLAQLEQGASRSQSLQPGGLPSPDAAFRCLHLQISGVWLLCLLALLACLLLDALQMISICWCCAGSLLPLQSHEPL